MSTQLAFGASLVLLTAPFSCFGQGVALGLSSATGSPGSPVILGLTLNNGSADPPSSVEWTFGYSNTDFSSATVSLGSTAATAGKSVSCNNTAGGLLTCLLWGQNATSIASGLVANVALTLSGSTTNKSSQIQVSNVVAANVAGMPLSTSAGTGTVTIQQPTLAQLTGITVSPGTIFSGQSPTGTVTLSAAAGNGGVNVSLSSSNTSVANVPPAVVVPQGSTSATFPVNTGTVTGATAVLLTASYSGVNATANVTINPDFAVSSSPTSRTIAAGGNTTYALTVSAINGFTGSAALSISGLPTGATAIFNPSSVTGSGASTLSISAAGSTVPGNYSLTLSAQSGNFICKVPLALVINPPLASLPANWTDLDIGAPAKTGSATYNSGTFTVSGGGADVWNTSDHFNYSFQQSTGDLTILAQVATQQNTNSWAKSGVMIRETTAADSKYVFVMVTPGSGLSMQYRSSTGGGAIDLKQNAGPVAPYWLMLVRAANTFTGYTSVDGKSWTVLGATTFAMNSGANVGLAVTAHNDGVLNASTFTDVRITTPRYQINSGGPAQAPFVADLNYAGGNTYAATASVTPNGQMNRAPMAAYQTERNGNFSYTLPDLLPAATYTVRLHFAENHWTLAGQRSFNVTINGNQVLTNFDIIAATGKAHKALIEEFSAIASPGGQIVVQYAHGQNANDSTPQSSAIEVVADSRY